MAKLSQTNQKSNDDQQCRDMAAKIIGPYYPHIAAVLRDPTHAYTLNTILEAYTLEGAEHVARAMRHEFLSKMGLTRALHQLVDPDRARTWTAGVLTHFTGLQIVPNEPDTAA